MFASSVYKSITTMPWAPIQKISVLTAEIIRLSQYKVLVGKYCFNSRSLHEMQDYKVHRDEIHSKLVQIMRERLLIHLRGLPQIVEGWNRLENTDTQPSQFARSITKVQVIL